LALSPSRAASPCCVRMETWAEAKDAIPKQKIASLDQQSCWGGTPNADTAKHHNGLGQGKPGERCVSYSRRT